MACLATAAHAGTAKAVRVEWDRNPETDIARYDLLYGTSSGNYSRTVGAGTEISAAVTDLQEGSVYYFAVTATNTSGLTSERSSEVVYYAGISDELPAATWTTSSPEGTKAFDGDAGTIFLSGPGTTGVHDLDISLGGTQAVEGLRYLPRQDGSTVGNIANYEIYLSQDGVSWGSPVAAGTFSSSGEIKEVRFAAQDTGFIRLRSLTEVNGLNECSVAELEVIQKSTLPVTGNQAPVGLAASYTTSEDQPVAIVLSASDADADAIQFSIASAPAHGTLSGTPPNLLYTPSADFNGTDSFTFVANDGKVNSAATTISLAVTPVNDSPTALPRTLATAKNVALPVLLTGTDPENDALTFAVSTSPQHGTLSGSGPNLLYTPAQDFTGADSFAFRASDGIATSAPAIVTISVAAANSPPSAKFAYLTTQQNLPLAITLSATDADNDPLTFSLGIRPAHGVLTGLPPNLIYTPQTGYVGTDYFTFFANDGSVSSAETVNAILVAPGVQIPVAAAQSVATSKRIPVTIQLSATNPNSGTLTFAIVSSPAHGSLSGTPPNLTYTPTGNFTGSDSFTFKANDGTSDSAAASVSINIADSNTAPVAVAKSVTTAEDTAVAVVLTGTDLDLDPLTFAVVTAPAHGTLSGTAPNLTYTPAANFNGSDSFTFRANDGSLNSASAIVSIIVTPVNDAPLAGAKSVTTPEDTAVVIALTGSDPEFDPLTFAVVSAPVHGTLSGTAPNLTYTPAANFNGSDSFTFRVNDGSLNSATATVSITVTPVNDAPLAVAKSVTTVEDTAVPVVLTGTDVDGDPLTFTVASAPAHGTLSGTAPNLTYTPAADFNGSDSFTFRVNDGTVSSATATVSITVTPVNDAPLAVAKSVTTAEDTPVSIVLTGTDKDLDALTFVIAGSPAHGTLSGTAPNLTYTPAANFNGADTFTFRVNDGTVNSAIAAVSIIVSPVNDAPVALAQSLTTLEGNPLPINLGGTDIEGDALTFTVVTAPTRGTLSGTAPNFTYTPAAGYSGNDALTFRVNDSTSSSAVATVGITVTKRPSLPGTTVVSRTGWSLKYVDSQEAFDGLATSAFDGDPTTSWHTQWRTGTLTPTPHEIQINLGTSLSLTGFQYLPRQDSYSVGNIGSYEFYVSTDGVNWGTPVATGDFENSATEKQVIFTAKTGQFIRLRAITEASGSTETCVAELNVLQGNLSNKAPLATAQTLVTEASTPLPIHLAGSDPEGFALSYSVASAPLHGTLTGTAPDLTYLPVAGYKGQDQFSFRVNDGAEYSAAATVAITVNPVVEVPGNRAPAFGNELISFAALEDSGFEGQLLASDADAGDVLTFRKISGPAWLTISAEGALGGTPLNSDVGENTFTVKVSDVANASATATLTITVSNTNDAPVFKINPLFYTAGTEKMDYRDQSLAATATDPDLGDTFTYSVVSGPEWLTVAKTGELGGTPPVGSAGVNSFTIRVTDAAGAFNETTLQIKVNSNTLPLPWNLYRVGNGNVAGGAKYNAGTFTVAGAGVLSESEDAGNFGWQTLSNDGGIIARVSKLDDTGTSTRVGLMIRESLASDSRQVFVGVDGNGKYQFLRRAVAGGKSSRAYRKADTDQPIWLRLVRKDDTISAYKSNDGVKWTKIGKTNVRFPKNCYMGISVSSGNKKELNTSKFSNVRVSR